MAKPFKKGDYFKVTIEVYGNKFYRYADPDYSISDSPIDDDMYELVTEAVVKLRQCDARGIPSDLDALLAKVRI